ITEVAVERQRRAPWAAACRPPLGPRAREADLVHGQDRRPHGEGHDLPHLDVLVLYDVEGLGGDAGLDGRTERGMREAPAHGARPEGQRVVGLPRRLRDLMDGGEPWRERRLGPDILGVDEGEQRYVVMDRQAREERPPALARRRDAETRQVRRDPEESEASGHQMRPASTCRSIHGITSSRIVSSGVVASKPRRRLAFSTDGTRRRTSYWNGGSET